MKLLLLPLLATLAFPTAVNSDLGSADWPDVKTASPIKKGKSQTIEIQSKNLNESQKNKGFSLIELVVVVGVLAILAAISIPSFNNITMKTKIIAAKTNLVYILQECIVYSQLNGIPNPTFRQVNLGKSTNYYGDSFGINFGSHDGFTYDTSMDSAMPTRLDSSCMRVAAKSHSKDGLGQTYYFPHFEIYYDSNLKKVQKNCVIQVGAYNNGNLCDTSKPYGSQW